jgi:hypothetical protein
MARKRMIEPQIWDDPDFSALSRDARLLFIGLISHADDYGHITARPSTLRKLVFGYDDDLTVEDVERLLAEIVEACRNVQIYECDGQRYLWLKKWERHQDLRFRAQGLYPCHVCGALHKAKEFDNSAAFAEHFASDSQGLTHICASTTQGPRNICGPREEKRREDTSCRSNVKRREAIAANAAPAPSDSSQAKPLTPSQQMFVVLCEVCGRDYHKMTKPEKGPFNTAEAALREAGYTPDDVRTMARNYPSHFDDCAMTPTALAKHAGLLMAAKTRASPSNGRGGRPVDRAPMNNDPDLIASYAAWKPEVEVPSGNDP